MSAHWKLWQAERLKKYKSRMEMKGTWYKIGHCVWGSWSRGWWLIQDPPYPTSEEFIQDDYMTSVDNNVTTFYELVRLQLDALTQPEVNHQAMWWWNCSKAIWLHQTRNSQHTSNKRRTTTKMVKTYKKMIWWIWWRTSSSLLYDLENGSHHPRSRRRYWRWLRS